MAKHARFSPSRLDGLKKCVRFKHIEMEDAATEGTELHKAFETGCLDGLNEEQRRVVQQALDYVDSIKAGGVWVECKEVKLELKDLTFGTADRVLLPGVGNKVPEAHVMDFKGIRVDSDYDFQVRTYAAAVLEQSSGLETISTHVLAPRLGQGPLVKTYGRKLLAEVRAEIEDLYARIDDPWLPPTPHEDICGKCANARGCPAMGVTVKTASGLAGLPVPSEFAPDKLVTERDRMIAQVLAVVFINWAEQVKKHNTDYVADNGGEVPGFKLVSRSTGLRVSRENTAEAVRYLKERLALTDDEIISAATISPAELAKGMCLTRGGTEADNKQKIRDVLGDLANEGMTRYLQKTKKINEVTMLTA